jgi:hypothetical protein
MTCLCVCVRLSRIFRLFIPLALLAGMGMAFGQEVRGSITGRVTDATAAALPDVNITITNQQTGVKAHTVTDGSGNFTVPELDAGVYSVTAEKAGFRQETATGLQLLAQQTLRSDMKLQVGAASENVQVSSETPLIDTENGAIATPITTLQLKNLPTTLQDIDSFLILAAGVGRATFNSSPQIAGSTHWGADNFTLNGVSVNDPGNGGGSYSFSLGGVNLPALSSLQEVQIGGIGMDARYSRIVNVQMVTKNGTNRFHGETYEYLENTALNANTFVNNAARIARAPFHRSEFGGDTGGPILRDKTFFFFDYDGVREAVPITVQDNLPTAAEKQGNFGALCATYNGSGVCNAAGGVQLYNPQTGQPFANNVLTPTSQALALLAFVPNPTDPTSLGLPQGTKAPNGVAEQYNYTISLAQFVHVNKWDLRLDHHLSDHDSLFGVYSHSVGLPWFDPLDTPPTYGNGADYGYKTYSLSATETHTFGPKTVNSLRGAWFDHESIRSGQNGTFNPYSLFPQLTSSNNRGLPTMTTTGYTAIGDIGLVPYTHEYDVEITDDFTHVMGRHTLQAGLDETGFKIYVPTDDYGPLGAFTFNGTWTGNGGWPGNPTSVGNTLADFELGDAISATTGNAKPNQDDYSRDWEFYGQDVWQVSRSLTFNYGLRYVYQSPWDSKGNLGTYFSFSNNALVLPENSTTPSLPPNAPANNTSLPNYPFTTTGALGLPETFYSPDRNNFGPRLGFAWRVLGSINTVLRGGYGIYYNFNAGYIGFNDNILNPPWGASVTYTTGKPSKPTTTYLPDITFNAPFPVGTAAAPAANPTVYAMTSKFPNARIQQFNLTLEHQFRDEWKARASYVGNRTVNLPVTLYNTNIPVVQQPTGTLQSERPYQPWGVIDTTNTENFSNTDQLELEALHQFSQGFMVQSQYEWTNCRDIAPPTGAGPQIVTEPRLDYGNCPYLARHTFVTNYVYDLPFGHDRKYLSHGVLGEIVGGWTWSGITTYETGPAFSVTFTAPSTYPGWIAGRANVVPGVNPYIHNHAHSTTATWLNPAAFVVPAPGLWGDSPRNGYFGPGYWDYDMSVQKAFPIREGQGLIFRADFLDAFNHTNWDGGGTTIGGVAAPVVATASASQYGGTAVANFGDVTSGEGSRIIQASLRYTF